MKQLKFVWIAVLALTTLVACPATAPAPNPSANGYDFFADPGIWETCVSKKVTLTPKDTASESNVSEVEYDFGDNTGLLRTSNRNVSHVYLSPGTYVASVKVFNAAGTSVLNTPKTINVIVSASNTCKASSSGVGINSPLTYIVVRDDAPTTQSVSNQTLVSAVGGQLQYEYTNVFKGFAAVLTNAQASKLGVNSEIETLSVDNELTISAVQTPTTWGLDRIDQRDLPLSSAFNYQNTGVGTHFYGVDTGIRASHSEFAGRVGNGFDAYGEGLEGQDCHGHGTHTAGIAAGKTYGVARGATIHPVRVLKCSGGGTYAAVIAGVDWVAGNAVKPAVMNLSLGGGVNDALETALKAVIAKGIHVVVSAGNDGAGDACQKSPARLGGSSDVLTVAASTNDDRLAGFSNVGRCVDIVAPGSNIRSAWKTDDNAVQDLSGTSMAAPYVAGALLAYLQANPTATPNQAQAALLNDASSGKIQGLTSSTPNKLLFINGGATSVPAGVTVALNTPDFTMRPGEQYRIEATVSGSSNTSVAWEYGSGGTDSSGNTVLFTAPTTPGVYFVKATSLADATKSARVNITVSAAPSANPVAVSVTPAAVTMRPGATQDITATVTGSTNTAVTWEYGAGGAAGGSNTVRYTAPTAVGRYYVKATSVADPSKSAATIIEVSAQTGVVVTITPQNIQIKPNEAVLVKALVSGSSNTDFSWELTALPGGVSGTTPAQTSSCPVVADSFCIKWQNSTATYTLTARSAADPTKIATTTISFQSP